MKRSYTKDVNGIHVEVFESSVKCTKVEKSKFDVLQAELQMKIKTIAHLPSKQVSNEYNGNIFTAQQCGFDVEKRENIETRTGWIPVPQGSTVESVNAELAKYEKARLYKILSSSPIIRQGQKQRIDAGELSLDKVVAKQVARYGKGTDKEGQPILFKGAIQYRQIFFSPEGKEDIDERTTVEVKTNSSVFNAEIPVLDTVDDFA